MSVATGALRDEVAVVSGGSSGLGQAVCVALARAGAHVVVVGRDRSRLEDTAREVRLAGSRALTVAADIRDEDAVTRMVAKALENFGRIDVLVASAGIGGGGELVPRPVMQTKLAEWRRVVDTNLTGVFLCNRAVLPTMRAQGRGEIVNVVSARGGTTGHPYAAAYCASKFAVAGLSRALAHREAEEGVRVHAIFPDAVETPMLGGSRFAPLRLSPRRVADFIIYLLALPRDCVVSMPIVAPLGAPTSSTGRLEMLS